MSRNQLKWMLALGAGSLMGVACGGEAEPEEAPTETPAETAEAPTEETAEAADGEGEAEAEISAAAIPVPADFEAEMNEQVTGENYRAELDALAAELEE